MLIRDATTADAFGIARVHIDSWRSAYNGLMPKGVLDGLSIEESAERWARIIADAQPGSRLLIAEQSGNILAWSSFGDARDGAAPATAELWGIYAHPDSWSSGVGRALLTAVEAALWDAEHRSAYLWVLDGNDRATRFYERHGWIVDGGVKVDERPGMILREHRRVKVLASASA